MAVVTRRDLLRRLGRVLGLVALAETVAAAGLFLWPRRPRSREGAYGGVVTAGPVALFEPGTVTAFAKGQFYLVRLADGGFLALSRKCTHLGCTVPWVEAEHQFVCPCHASAFDIRGDVINPPAPRALDLFEVRVENRVVKVNTANRERRSAFAVSQVTRA